MYLSQRLEVCTVVHSVDSLSANACNQVIPTPNMSRF